MTCVIPLVLLVILYLVTDPFKTLKPFSLEYFDQTNRDYISSELYLWNNSKYHYNSFIFGSSRACGLNSYKWKQYLPEGSRQYVFQGWGETITGIYQKINYIDSHNDSIKNAIVLIDIPGSFDTKQLPTKVLSIKDYKFSGQSRFMYHCMLFKGYIKPSKIIQSISSSIRHNKPYICFDTISNDWEKDNINNCFNRPVRDSLSGLSVNKRERYIKQYALRDDAGTADVLIDGDFQEILVDIKSVFEKQKTEYKIVISPGYYKNSPKINPDDLETLQSIFGRNRVYDYSGKNELTDDIYNFTDPGHFGLYVGWQIFEDIYEK